MLRNPNKLGILKYLIQNKYYQILSLYSIDEKMSITAHFLILHILVLLLCAFEKYYKNSHF